MTYLAFRTIAVLIASYITSVGVPLVFAPITLWTAFLVAFTLAIINHTIKPLFVLVSIPVTFATLGLFSFVINGVMILLAAKVVPSFGIPNLLMAIYFSVVLAIVNWLLHIFE
jgi:putative membrane protein